MNKNPSNNLYSNQSNNKINKSTSETQIITINNNSNSNNIFKSSSNSDANNKNVNMINTNNTPVPKTIKLKLSVIRAPHTSDISTSSNITNKMLDNSNTKNKPFSKNNFNNKNSPLIKNENKSISNTAGNLFGSKTGKSIFTTSPFVTYNMNNTTNNNVSDLKPQINNPSSMNLIQQGKTSLNCGVNNKNQKSSSKNMPSNSFNKYENSNNNNIYNLDNSFQTTINNFPSNNNNFNSNKILNEHYLSNAETKNNINININTGIPCSGKKCFSPKSSSFNRTNNIQINTSSINNSTQGNNTNNININISNNFNPTSNASSIININNFCNSSNINKNNNFETLNNQKLKNNNSNTNNLNANTVSSTNSNISSVSNKNTNNNNLINNNQNIITLNNFNTSLFQSLAAIDFKDPEKKKIKKRLKEMRIKHKRFNREGSYNCGRWQPEEHKRFIEAIMKFGNEWKQVQKYVGTRSSTQARSHAQKFFVKIKRSNILDFNIDLSKNSIKKLHEMANNLNSDQYVNAIKALNCVAFERKANSSKRKNKKDEQNIFDSNMNLSDECHGKINYM